MTIIKPALSCVRLSTSNCTNQNFLLFYFPALGLFKRAYDSEKEIRMQRYRLYGLVAVR